MDSGRRQFLKGSTLAGAAVSVLGFDLRPAAAEVRELKIARTTQTLHLPLLRGGLRRDHPHAGRPGAQRQADGRPRRGRPRSRSTAARSVPRASRSRRTSSTTGVSRRSSTARRAPPSGKTSPGTRRSPAWRGSSRTPAIAIFEHRRRGRTVNRCAHRDRLIGGCTDTNEINYLLVKASASAWASCRTKTRPAFDTAPRWPVWPPRSDAAR